MCEYDEERGSLSYKPCVSDRFPIFKFTYRHATEVIETDGWNRMVRENPHLVAEVFKALAHQIPGVGPIRKRLKHT